MARILKSLIAVPAGIIAAAGTGLSPVLLVIAASVLVLISAVLFVPSREPVQRLAQLLTAARGATRHREAATITRSRHRMKPVTGSPEIPSLNEQD